MRRGRKEGFSSFHGKGEPPDPQAEATFLSAKLDWSLRDREHHRSVLDLYRELLRLRREEPALGRGSAGGVEVSSFERERVIAVRRSGAGREALLLLHFSEAWDRIASPGNAESWRKALDTAEERFEGPGSRVPGVVSSGGEVELAPWSAVLLRSDAFQR